MYDFYGQENNQNIDNINIENRQLHNPYDDTAAPQPTPKAKLITQIIISQCVAVIALSVLLGLAFFFTRLLSSQAKYTQLCNFIIEMAAFSGVGLSIIFYKKINNHIDLRYIDILLITLPFFFILLFETIVYIWVCPIVYYIIIPAVTLALLAMVLFSKIKLYKKLSIILTAALFVLPVAPLQYINLQSLNFDARYVYISNKNFEQKNSFADTSSLFMNTYQSNDDLNGLFDELSSNSNQSLVYKSTKDIDYLLSFAGKDNQKYLTGLVSKYDEKFFEDYAMTIALVPLDNQNERIRFDEINLSHQYSELYDTKYLGSNEQSQQTVFCLVFLEIPKSDISLINDGICLYGNRLTLVNNNTSDSDWEIKRTPFGSTRYEDINNSAK